MKSLHSPLMLCGMLTIIIAMLSMAARGEPPITITERSVYQLGSRWTTDAGRDIKLADLSGRYQIVAFIFTHCPGACPVLVKSLQVQARNMPAQIRERAGFLLVSIDPTHDTVSALRRYRKDMGLDARWTLLRGADGDVRELAAALGFNYERMPDGLFAHSRQVTLLDPVGEIALQHPFGEDVLSVMNAAIDAGINDATSINCRPAAGNAEETRQCTSF
jgi:cytochrome oxidase Cu insertion factor (SCO1/SenC/PrrC family)